jgi:hypothetical protein
MKAAPLALIPLLCALAAPGDAQTRSPGGPRTALTRANGGGVLPHRGFNIPFFYPEREVIIEPVRQAQDRHEIIREVPLRQAQDTPPEPPPPRKPYVIGASYASLPSGCMKMVEAGGSYFYCGGEWYRQVGSGYRAVREP